MVKRLKFSSMSKPLKDEIQNKHTQNPLFVLAYVN